MFDQTPARAVATRIVRTLRENRHVAYFAGGCVRDELLGLSPEDYDVATDAHPEHVRTLFRRTNEVGAAFGVMLVTLDRITVEVATFREEGVYSDRRRPDEVVYADAERDARRRDFTINALFLDPLEPPAPAAPPPGAPFGAPPHQDQPADPIPRPVNGRILDFVGGMDDLRARIIRAVGDPDRRLAEDNLRALRAVRFVARLAPRGFRLDDPTADAIRRHAAELTGVSRERIGQELRRMLAHPSRAAAAAWMDRLELSVPVLQDSAPACAPASGDPLMTITALPPDAGFTGALAAWTLDRLADADGLASPARLMRESAAIVARLRTALCLTNDERDALRDILQGLVLLDRDWARLTIAHQKRAAASTWFQSAVELLAARAPDVASRIRQRTEALAEMPPGLAPPRLITGDDLIAAGLTPGPAMGRWLEAAYDAQLEGRIRDRDAALALVREMAGQET